MLTRTRATSFFAEAAAAGLGTELTCAATGAAKPRTVLAMSASKKRHLFIPSLSFAAALGIESEARTA